MILAKLHVVFMSTGIYSDRNEYALFITRDEKLAQSAVLELGRLFTLVDSVRSADWDRGDALNDAAVAALRRAFPHAGFNDYMSINDDSKAWVSEVPEMAAMPGLAPVLALEQPV